MPLFCQNLLYSLLKIRIRLLLLRCRSAININGMTNRRPHMPREKDKCEI